MNISFDLKKSVFRKKLDKGSKLAVKALAEQIIKDSDQFVPRLEGDLRSYVRPEVKDKGAYIIYNSPYATYQWFGVRADGSHKVTKYTTSGTQKEWIKVAERQYGKTWMKIANKAFKGGID